MQRPPLRKPRRNAPNASRRRKGIVPKANAADHLHKDHAAKAVGRAIVKAGVRRTAAGKLAVVIAVTTGVAAIAAASKARPRSTLKN